MLGLFFTKSSTVQFNYLYLKIFLREKSLRYYFERLCGQRTAQMPMEKYSLTILKIFS